VGERAQPPCGAIGAACWGEVEKAAANQAGQKDEIDAMSVVADKGHGFLMLDLRPAC